MIFDISYFQKLTKSYRFPSKVIALESTPSTNQWLKECDEECFEHGILVIADHQTKGRGQYRRTWVSGPGVNITCSLGLIPHRNRNIHTLIHLTGLSIAMAIQENYPTVSVQLKWPNDILFNGKKAGGVLTETVFQGNKVRRVILGFGLNINLRVMPKELERTATSLLLESGRATSREEVLSTILSNFNKYYHSWERDIYEWKHLYNEFLLGMNKRCRCVLTTQKGESSSVIGMCKGLQSDGMLLIEDEDGEKKRFSHEQIRIYPLE